MGDFEEKLNTVLNDPESMEQIFKLAQQLSGAQVREKPSEPEDGGDLANAAKVMELLKNAQAGSQSRYSYLLEALKPYLKKERQDRLERAIKLSRLSRLAKMAIESGMIGEI